MPGKSSAGVHHSQWAGRGLIGLAEYEQIAERLRTLSKRRTMRGIAPVEAFSALQPAETTMTYHILQAEANDHLFSILHYIAEDSGSASHPGCAGEYVFPATARLQGFRVLIVQRHLNFTRLTMSSNKSFCTPLSIPARAI